MNGKKVFRKYMDPFLKERGFVRDGSDGAIVFRYKENPNLAIIFELRSNRIAADFIRFKSNDHLMSYSLMIFFDNPKNGFEQLNSGWWHFDTTEELVGILEEYAEIMEKNGFDWLFGRVDYDLDQLIRKRANEIGDYCEKLSEEELSKWQEDYIAKIQRWKKRRVLPKRWVVD